MEHMRKPFQGVLNIIRFNRHFYGVAVVVFVLLILVARYNESLQWYLYGICSLVAATLLISLLVSFYIYDLSGLYHFKWARNLKDRPIAKIVNINAGFDESSEILKHRFNDSELIVLDFYNPLKHTELSIKRARKAYPPYPGTRHIKTDALLLEDDSADIVFAILSAHEIRDKEERNAFFKELNRIIKPDGRIAVTEHLRDTVNFMTYTLGFFHFHSRKTWLDTFSSSGLIVEKEIKCTPFITTFILKKNGITS